MSIYPNTDLSKQISIELSLQKSIADGSHQHHHFWFIISVMALYTLNRVTPVTSAGTSEVEYLREHLS
jgi:hypothetical protein